MNPVVEAVRNYIDSTAAFMICLFAFMAYLVGLCCLLCKLFPKLDKDDKLFEKLLFGHLIGGVVLHATYMLIVANFF